jgi:hypothetical protein
MQANQRLFCTDAVLLGKNQIIVTCVVQIYEYLMFETGQGVAQLVEALCYKPERCGFDPRWCLWNFSLT